MREKRVDSQHRARVKVNGQINFSARALYPGIRTSPKQYSASVSGTGESDGSWKVTGTVGVKW